METHEGGSQKKEIVRRTSHIIAEISHEEGIRITEVKNEKGIIRIKNQIFGIRSQRKETPRIAEDEAALVNKKGIGKTL